MKRLITLILLTLISCPLYPQENDGSLFHLGLEELSKIVVVVASKKKEYLHDAPSILSVVTAEEINASGAKNLLEVLGKVTSIQPTGSNFFPNNMANIRSATLTHSANHILILINGRPFRDSAIGGLNFSLYLSFPLLMIERLEIIRGPGSILYGSNAFAGVINIVTKTTQTVEKTSVQVSTGSFSTHNINAMVPLNGEEFESIFAVKLLSSDGWNMELTDANNVSGSLKRSEESIGVSYWAKYKGLNFSSLYTETEQGITGISVRFPEDKVFLTKFFADIGYTQEFKNSWQGQYNLTYNRLIKIINDNPFPGVKPGYASDYLLEATFQGPLPVKNLNMLIGGSAEHHDGHLISRGIRYTTRWYSGYLQFDYAATDSLRLVAGAQLSKPEEVAAVLSPRLSAVYKINDAWGAKLLYGEAFRSAYDTERFVSLSRLIGNPNLKPETIATTDLQLYYNSADTYAALTYYHSEMKDIVTKVPIPNDPPKQQYMNAGEITFDGVELEGKINFNDNWQATGSASWQENESDTGIKGSTFTPNWMAKLGVTYDSNTGYQVGLFDTYYGTPTPISVVNDSVLDNNPTAESYHLLTANINVDLNKIMQLSGSTHYQLSFFLDNLLDDDIHMPEINRQTVNTLPAHSERAFYAQVQVSF